MLRERILTATVLIAICLLLLFWAPAWILSGAIDLVILAASWEWSRIAYLEKASHRLSFVVVFAIALLCSSWLPIVTILWLSVIWWLFALCLVMRYKARPPHLKNERLPRKILVSSIFAFLVLIPFDLSFKALLTAKEGPQLMFFIFLIVWAADSAAYFCGRKWGKHKLLPQVSPAKTVEGLLGGIFGAILVGWLWYFWVGKSTFSVKACLLILAVAGAGVLGDLFESMMKRQRGIKDSGNWLPGHGGVLDRIDSLTAAFPVFLFFYQKILMLPCIF